MQNIFRHVNKHGEQIYFYVLVEGTADIQNDVDGFMHVAYLWIWCQ